MIVTSDQAKESLALQKLASKITNIPEVFSNGKTNRLDINKIKATIRNYGGSVE